MGWEGSPAWMEPLSRDRNPWGCVLVGNLTSVWFCSRARTPTPVKETRTRACVCGAATAVFEKFREELQFSGMFEKGRATEGSVCPDGACGSDAAQGGD